MTRLYRHKGAVYREALKPEQKKLKRQYSPEQQAVEINDWRTT